MNRRADRRARRAVRLMDRADRLLRSLPEHQPAPAVAAALPSPPGSTRRGLVNRTRAALMRRGVERIMSHPKATAAAAVVVGVAVGVVFVAVLFGALIAGATRQGDDW